VKAAVLIQPHFDDGCLSMGQFLAGRPGVTVATVFAGLPRDPEQQTDYDKLCGFADANEALTSRAEEDRLALMHLKAKPVRFDHSDNQYGETTRYEDIVRDIKTLLERRKPELVLGPLGLLHPDHQLTRHAVLEATRDTSIPVYVYEELPHRVSHPVAVGEALTELRSHGYILTPAFVGTGPLSDKLEALVCYRSQLPLFENHHEYLARERVWLVTR
jgi:LmbE family N-acetylglucosaminyl deacetylase